MGIVVDHHAGRQTAGADAGHCFQSKPQVIRSSPASTPGAPWRLRISSAARTWQAVPRQIRRYNGHAASGGTGHKCNHSKTLLNGIFSSLISSESFFGQVAIDILGFLQDRNKPSFVVAVLVQQLSQRRIFFCQINFSQAQADNGCSSFTFSCKEISGNLPVPYAKQDISTGQSKN